MLSYLCCTDRSTDIDDEEAKRIKAATKIQATQRGKIGRRNAATRKAEIDAYKQAAAAGATAEDLGDADVGNVASSLLCIEIVSAKTLRNCVSSMMGKKSSPFVKCDVGGVAFCTNTIKSNLNPTWNEKFEIVDYVFGTDIQLSVFHPSVGKKPEVCLGEATLVAQAFAGEEGCSKELQLTNTGLKKGGSTLKVNVSWIGPQRTENKRISAYNDQPAETWIVRFRPIGLRAGPGVGEQRVNMDLQPGEEFEVVEVVEGAGGQAYLRLKDGRGWAFTKSPKDGEALCEPLQGNEGPEIEDAGDDAAGADEEAQAEEQN